MRIIALVTLTLVIAGCTETAGPGPGSHTSMAPTTTSDGMAPGAIHFFYDFGGEKAGPGDLTGWKAVADIPNDPQANPPLSWNVTACDKTGWEDHVHTKPHPVHSACYAVGGQPGAGAIWIGRAFEIVPGRSYRANLTLYALGQGSSGMIGEVLMRIADAPATSGSEFGTSSDGHHASLRRPVVQEGWSDFNLTWEVGPLTGDHVVVEIGVFTVWRDSVTRYLDALTVDLTPIPA